MSIYSVTHSVTPTALAKKVVDEIATTDTSTVSESPVVADVPVTSETQTTAPNINTQVPTSSSLTSPSNDITGSLTKNVLQTMQNMGFNTASLSADDKQVLQNFVQK